MTTSPCPFARRAGRLGGGRLGSRLGGLVGDLALADPVLRLAVGEDLAEVATDRLGAHPRLVAVAQPLLGLGREDEQVALALAADRLHLPGVRSDRQHHRLERGVQVGADPGGDGGALARVGVERLDAGERARVDLAEVLVDGLDVGAALLDREGHDQPAGEIHAARARGDELRRDRLELLAPAAGDDRVQPLDDGLGADVGGDLRAGVGLAVVRHLGHRAKADRAGRERPAEQGGRLGVGAGGRVRLDVRMGGHESPLRGLVLRVAADADAL